MAEHAVGGGDPEPGADLLDRGGVALLPDGPDQEVIDQFLPGGQTGEHERTIVNLCSPVKSGLALLQKLGKNGWGIKKQILVSSFNHGLFYLLDAYPGADHFRDFVKSVPVHQSQKPAVDSLHCGRPFINETA